MHIATVILTFCRFTKELHRSTWN